MKYDFDTVYDRRNTDSIKWAVGEDELPMWVADMDFRTAPEVLDALKRRVEHGIFGYTDITDEWYAAYSGWWQAAARNGKTISIKYFAFILLPLIILLRKLPPISKGFDVA